MNVKFVERLKQLIADQSGGKPTVFAKRAGIPPGTFANYLSGRLPQAEQLIRIRETYGVNIDWLLTGFGRPYVQVDSQDEVSNYPHMDIGEETPPEIMGLLVQARRVLMSGNDVATRALRHNITYFDRAIEAEHRADAAEHAQAELMNRIADMESRLAKLEGDPTKKKESNPDPDADTDATAAI